MMKSFVSATLLAISACVFSSCNKSDQEGASREKESQTDASLEVAQRSFHKDEEAPVDAPKRKRAATPEVKRADETVAAIKEEAPQGAIILEDLSTIKLHPGSESPQVGDLIYAYDAVPINTCGEYWVKDDQGFVQKLAVCTGGEGHSH